MELREGAIIANRFRLVRMLGRGGMGEVWAAQHTSLEIPCAVKFILGDSAHNPEVRARFEREAKAAASLRSPNVVQILDYGIYQDTPYIGMEYLEGEPLDARLKRRGHLDPVETYHIIRGVGRALGKAHAAGIVHRDLKPDNIFLVRDEDQEIPKVLDFGVAKQSDTLNSNTQTGALLGTPYYMSPEQAQGTREIDHRSDLWSLAVVAFRCMTGELPFKSQALGDLLIKIVTHPIPTPTQVAPGLPPALDGWWQRATQREAGQRYPSAKELVEGLGQALGVQPGATTGAGHVAAPAMPSAPAVYGSAAPPFTQSGASQLVPPQQNPATGGPGWAVADPQTQALDEEDPAPPPATALPAAPTPMGTVAGVTSTTAPAKSSGSKGLMLGLVVLVVLGLGGAGAFVAVRGTDAEVPPVDGPEAAAAPPEEMANEDGGDAEAPSGEDDAEDPADNADDTEAEASAAPARPPSPAAPPASPPPAPRPTPTNLDVPKPPPKPRPQGFDPGF